MVAEQWGGGFVPGTAWSQDLTRSWLGTQWRGGIAEVDMTIGLGSGLVGTKSLFFKRCFYDFGKKILGQLDQGLFVHITMKLHMFS